MKSTPFSLRTRQYHHARHLYLLRSFLDFGAAILFFWRTLGFPSSDYSEFGFVGLRPSIFIHPNSKTGAKEEFDFLDEREHHI
jgi:hypothetical protein